jgi:Mce-associated membrane protein
VKPADAKAAGSEAGEPADAKPEAAKPADAEAAEPADAKPADAEPADGKPEAAESEPASGTGSAKTTVLPASIVAGGAATGSDSGAVDTITGAGDTSDTADDIAAGDSEDEQSGGAASGTARKPRKPRKPIPRPRPLVAALSLLLVVLLVAGVTLFVHNHRVSEAEASKAAALETARQVATSLTTITPDNASGQLDNLQKQSTGSFKEQIGGYSAMFQAVLKQGNVASRGTITAAGIEKMEGDAASALVAVSALITSGQVPQGQPRTYRLLVSLQRSGDQWLASNVDFVQ